MRVTGASLLAIVSLLIVAAPAAADDNAFDTAKIGAEPMAPSTKPSIDGSFAIKGRGEKDAANYTGTATITKIGGDMYNAEWKIGKNDFKGICFRDDDQLSCAWAVKTKGLGVVAYLVRKDGLDGVWFETGGTKLGKEFLKPHTGKMLDLKGTFKITSGENPDGSKYTGTASIKPLSDVGENVYGFDWNISGTKVHGVGVRLTGGVKDVIATAFDTGSDYGALQYKISDTGKELTGVWVQSLGGKITKGGEQLNK